MSIRPAEDRVESLHRLVGPGCLVALLAACYGAALWSDEQFAFRDTAHFYGPLYRRVQREWEAGRVPLWAPEENGGAPLLGNPTAAVLYPGKILYAMLPDAWAPRLYVIAHTVLAFAGMRALGRSWGISRAGATIAALGYAFGAPVLFQYSNIIYLVGASWAPLGFRAADRWLRLGRRWALAELAVVLALQALGGDPEAAYLTALCAGGYALGLSRSGWARTWLPVLAIPLLAIFGAILAPVLPPEFLALRSRGRQVVLLLAWTAAGLVILVARRSGGGESGRARLLGLAGAVALSATLAAAQVVPAAEAILRSARIDGVEAGDLYTFSLQPFRMADLAWPRLFGTFHRGNRDWLLAVPWADRELWVPSLYLGGPTLALSLAAAGFRGEPPWRRWLTAVALVGLLAAFGKYAGLPRSVAPTVSGEGFGGPYWLLAASLPGFAWFRYPAKLLIFTALALSALAGLGWDRVAAGRSGRAAAVAATLATAGLAAWVAVSLLRGSIVAALGASPAARGVALFGPLDPAGSIADLCGALAQGAIVQTLTLGLIVVAPRRPRLAGAAMLAVLTVDLALANAWFVITAPRADLERTPAALAAIRLAERDRPSEATPRVFRMPQWYPAGWTDAPSRRRLRELHRWEYDTLQPSYGLDHGLGYTESSESPIEPGDFARFFRPFPVRLDAEAAAAFGGEPGRRVLYYPRRGFDLWGTRYFILPAFANGWRSGDRSFAAFLDETDLVYPDPETFRDPDLRRRWIESDDVQVRRNRAAFPRAWIVHEARVVPPSVAATPAGREELMRLLLFQDDALWHDPTRSALDLRAVGLVETARPADLRRLAKSPPGAIEGVTVGRSDPRRVELAAVLGSPGLVILADTDFPGWRLTIDGAPAPILRVNRMMRGAVVGAGRHTLAYTYDPPSFRVGVRISLAGLAGLTALALWALRSLTPMDRPPGRTESPPEAP